MADFDKVLVKDDRLVCSDKITYAVIKGAMNNTIVPYNAISGVGTPNPSSMTWNIQVPSEQIVIDRRVIVETEMTLEVVKTGIAASIAESVFNNGVDIGQAAAGTQTYGADALNVLPFHQLVTTAQVTINNTSVSLNVQDVLPALIRFNDSRYINEMNGMSPVQPDKYGTYGTTTNSTAISNGAAALATVIRNDEASPFATQTTSLDEAFVPRGSFPIECVASLASGAAPAARVATAGGAASATQFIRVVVREPLMVSPFIWACPQENSQGIYGVQNLSIVLNLSARDRLIRSRSQITNATGVQLTTTTINNFQINRCRLLMNYLTPQPSDLLVPRNVVPYQEFPRYFAQSVVAVASGTLTGSTIIPSSASASFNSIQLNQIPDKLIVYARPVNYNTNTRCSDHFLPIQSITVNFNNQSGLLSTWTKSQLYSSSRKNGCNQSWYEWSGSVQKDNGVATLQGLNGLDTATAFPANSINMPTTGSLCVLEFGSDIELPDYYAPGSLGNFNLQFNVVFENYSLQAITDYQLVVITMNSGVFVTEKGQSSVYTGILTKQDVLEASSMEPITGNAFKRMVGGGFWDSIKSIGSKVWRGIKSALPVASQIASAAAPALGAYGAPIAQGLSMANKLAGNGASGAGMGYGRRKVQAFVQ